MERSRFSLGSHAYKHNLTQQMGAFPPSVYFFLSNLLLLYVAERTAQRALNSKRGPRCPLLVPSAPKDSQLHQKPIRCR